MNPHRPNWFALNIKKIIKGKSFRPHSIKKSNIKTFHDRYSSKSDMKREYKLWVEVQREKGADSRHVHGFHKSFLPAILFHYFHCSAEVRGCLVCGTWWILLIFLFQQINFFSLEVCIPRTKYVRDDTNIDANKDIV